MAQNIMDNLRCGVLYRLDADFKIESTTLDSLLGRMAHIQVITNENFILALIHKYADIFCN